MTILPKCAVVLLSLSFTSLASAQLTFTTIDVPGAGVTGVYGINQAGEMVGYYGDSPGAQKHAFIFRDGVFTYFDYPGAYTTVATGINDLGTIVGYAEFQGGSVARGFLYDGTTFTPVQVGHKSATFTLGINNAGVVVGAAGTIYASHGMEMVNGSFKLLDFPGESVYETANAINNFNVVVGYTDYDAYAYKNGKFKNLDFPGAFQTAAWGINDSGVIVGWYDVTGPAVYGFAWKNGKYISFRNSGAQTFAAAINASGQIVGQYTFDYQTWHGYSTSPITPEDLERLASYEYSKVNSASIDNRNQDQVIFVHRLEVNRLPSKR